MTEEEKKLLNSFETQLRHLIYLHDELKRENAELKKLLENEKLKNEKVQAQYDELSLYLLVFQLFIIEKLLQFGIFTL